MLHMADKAMSILAFAENVAESHKCNLLCTNAKRQEIQRQDRELRVQDVGYRIAGKFKRSCFEDVKQGDDDGECTCVYSKMRTHYHHF